LGAQDYDRFLRKVHASRLLPDLPPSHPPRNLSDDHGSPACLFVEHTDIFHGDAASRRSISARNTTPPWPASTVIRRPGWPGVALNRPIKDNRSDTTRWLIFPSVFHRLFFASAFSDGPSRWNTGCLMPNTESSDTGGSPVCIPSATICPYSYPPYTVQGYMQALHAVIRMVSIVRRRCSQLANKYHDNPWTAQDVTVESLVASRTDSR
jgi:hypothetical protein